MENYLEILQLIIIIHLIKLYCLPDDMETAKLLEEKGINIDEKDMEGNIAFEIAQMNEQTDMINYIRGRTFMNPVQVTYTIVNLQGEITINY